MKRLATIAAATLATLALAGCMPQPVEFKAAPPTTPAIEPEDMPAPKIDGASWDASNVEYFGESAALEELARNSAQGVRAYADENPDTAVAQLSLVKAASEHPGDVSFSVSNDLSGEQLKQAAKATACAVVAEVPGTTSDGGPWLRFFTLTNAQTGENYTFSDTQVCK